MSTHRGYVPSTFVAPRHISSDDQSAATFGPLAVQLHHGIQWLTWAAGACAERLPNCETHKLRMKRRHGHIKGICFGMNVPFCHPFRCKGQTYQFLKDAPKGSMLVSRPILSHIEHASVEAQCVLVCAPSHQQLTHVLLEQWSFTNEESWNHYSCHECIDGNVLPMIDPYYVHKNSIW